MKGQTREQIDGQARSGLKMEYYSGCAGVRCCKLWSGGGFKKREKKKRKNEGDSVKGMWGLREGRVARWWPCRQKWRSQKGKLAWGWASFGLGMWS